MIPVVAAERSQGAVGVLAILATLAGAAAGVAGTLIVSDRQLIANRDTETRTVRATAYSGVLEAADGLWDEELKVVSDRQKYCAFQVTFRSKPICVTFEVPALRTAYTKWLKVERQVSIFGSPSAESAIKALDAFIAPSDLNLVPFSDKAQEYRMADNSKDAYSKTNDIIRQYVKTENRFLAVMCSELPAEPSACSAAS